MSWNGFLSKHFSNSLIPSDQTGFRRGMIWSPGSRMYEQSDTISKKPWNHVLLFMDIAQFEESMPSDADSPTHKDVNDVLSNGVLPGGTEAIEPSQQTIEAHADDEFDDDGEASMSFGTPVRNVLDMPRSFSEPIHSMSSDGSVSRVCSYSRDLAPSIDSKIRAFLRILMSR